MDRNQYLDEMKAHLADIESRISKARWNADQTNELQSAKEAVERQLAEITNAPENNWEKQRKELETLWNVLVTTTERLGGFKFVKKTKSME